MYILQLDLSRGGGRGNERAFQTDSVSYMYKCNENVVSQQNLIFFWPGIYSKIDCTVNPHKNNVASQ